jgi:acetolactate synthase I/III small subunit
VSSSHLRAEINGIIEPFRASIIDVSKESIAVQVTGKPEKIEALIEVLRPYGIKELARTGLTAFVRGQQPHVAELNSYTLLK